MTVDIAAIRARITAATPGPWKADTESEDLVGHGRVFTADGDVAYTWQGDEHDAHLIAHAPADLADLCDEVEELTADLYELRQQQREAAEVPR